MTGIFLSFEGIERCGKDTQIAMLESRLSHFGIPAVVAKEPGTTAVGGAQRALLKYAKQCYDALNEHVIKGNPDLTPLPADEMRSAGAEIFMYMAARAEFASKIVLPNIAQGKVVIANRLGDSTVAYQGGGLYDHDAEVIRFIEMLNRFALGGRLPDLTLLLDIPVEEMLKRSQDNHLPLDDIERRGVEYFRRVREEYHSIADRDPGRVRIIDGMKSPKDVFEKGVLPAFFAAYERAQRR